jgi:hypothetical protein
MKPRLIVAILVIAGLPVCAEAQQPERRESQGGRAKGRQNDHRRQGQEPDLLRYS